MKKRCACVLAALLVCAFCFGCLNAESLDHYGYVLGIAIDRGEQLPYRITLALQDTAQSGEGQSDKSFLTESAEAENLLSAIETLSGSMPFRLNFARTAMIVVSREVAMQETGMQEIFNTSITRLRIRNCANLYISLSDASDALSGLHNDSKVNLTKLQTNFAIYASETGLTLTETLADYYEAASGKCYDVVVPICGVAAEKETPLLLSDAGGASLLGGSLQTETDMKTQLAGAALFRGEQMTAVLNGQETQLLLMALGRFRQGLFRFRTSDGEKACVTLRRAEKTKRTLTLGPDGSGNQATFEISLSADADMLNTNGESTDAIERRIESELQTRLDALYQACRAQGIDAFALGKEAVKRFQTSQAWESFDWQGAYAQTEATFAVSVRLRHDVTKTETE